MARILENWNLVITKRVSVTGHYINSHPSVQAWMAFCCEFPAFLLPMAQKLRLQGEDVLEVELLVCRVRVMVLRVVFCALVTVRTES